MTNFNNIHQENYDEEFQKFKNNIKEELNTIWQLLEKPLSDELGELRQQLSKIEVWYHRLIYMLANADGFYNKAKILRLPMKTKDFTEMDRKMLLEDLVNDERVYRSKINGMIESIEQRIILGQSYLKSQKPFSGNLV